MEELKNLFLKIGYTEEECMEIINSYVILNIKQETLMRKVQENYEFLISLGYSNEEIIRMTKNLPTIFALNIDSLKQKIEDIQKLGYKNDEVIKMAKGCPSIFSYSIGSISKKIEEIQRLGYRRDEVIKMTKGLPTLYSLSIDSIKQKMEAIQKLGYSADEVIKITKGCPSIFSYSIASIRQKMEAIQKLGYSRQEVIEITKGLPTIYSLSIDNIKRKIEFYDSIGLHFLAVTDARQLMQSTKLSYARYMFFKENGISIDETNYRKLFTNQSRFKKQYGTTNEELIKRYPYVEEQEIESESKEKLIEEIISQQERIAEQKQVISELQSEKEDSREQNW